MTIVTVEGPMLGSRVAGGVRKTSVSGLTALRVPTDWTWEGSDSIPPSAVECVVGSSPTP